MNLPKDPYMLLSFVNTNLRDYFDNLDSFCENNNIDRKELEIKMDSIGYQYIKEENQFK